MSTRTAMRRGLTLSERMLAVSEGRRSFADDRLLVPLVPGSERRRKSVDGLEVVSTGGRRLASSAVVVPTTSQAKKIAKSLQVDVFWSSDGVHFTDRSLPRGNMIEVAEHFGPPLTSFRRKVDLSSIGRWTSLTEPGWRVGGELSLSCPECTRSLHWWDWTHASAPARSNTYVVACDRHGVVNKALRKPSELIMARRVLDSLEWAHAGTAAYQVYAFELQGVGHRQVYVGQTHRTVEERLVDHHDAARAVKAVRRGGVVGRLLQIPQLPPISHWRTALAAERWVAAHFEFRGFTVHGDGRR